MAINRTRSYNDKTIPEFISVISPRHCAKIRISDIEMIEQDGRKLRITTAEREYSFYEEMNTVARMLVCRAFFRPMKGLIINLDHVKDITGFYVNFFSGHSVSMGRNSVSNMRQAYKRYLYKYPPYSQWEPITPADTVKTAEAVAEPTAVPAKGKDTQTAGIQAKVVSNQYTSSHPAKAKPATEPAMLTNPSSEPVKPLTRPATSQSNARPLYGIAKAVSEGWAVRAEPVKTTCQINKDK